MMLSYLIDLTHLIRLSMAHKTTTTTTEPASSSTPIKACLARLNEMRVAFQRMRPMEKKLRYQIDKLLALSSGVFALVDSDDDDDDNKNSNHENKEKDQSMNRIENKNRNLKVQDDPLAFQPNLDDMGMENDHGLDHSTNDNHPKNMNNIDDEDDDHLKAAKSAIQSKKSNVYKPPRLFSTGTDSYTQKEKAEAKERKQSRRKRQLMSQNSELLQTLQSQYTDKPEEDDIRGGSGTLGASNSGGTSAAAAAAMGSGTGTANLWNVSAARRKVELRDRAKTEFEEEQFIRLVPSRKEKKERNRVFAEERSNLNLISDLGSLTRGISAFSDNYENQTEDDYSKRRGNRDRDGGAKWEGRFDNGKRKRGVDAGDDRGFVRKSSAKDKGKKKQVRATNSFQKELFGVKSTSSKGKKKKK